MAFPVTLNGRTYTLADFQGTNYVDGLPDAFEDFVTQAGNIYTTTSTSSVAIGTGSKTFTVADSGKPYIVGTPLRISDSAAPSTNWIDGIVTSYSGTTLIVDAVAYAGSGTISAWNINIGGSAVAYTGTLPIAQGGSGATTAAAARTNFDVYSKSEADSRFLNVSGEASDVTMTGNVTIGDAAGDTLTVNATADFNTGFNVDGTITADGLTVDGTDTEAAGSQLLKVRNSTTGEAATIGLYAKADNGGDGNAGSIIFDAGADGNAANNELRFSADHQTDTNPALSIAGNGDISFYEDTGTTPKFFWDASAEALGIGTSSPSAALHVNSGTSESVILAESTDFRASINLQDSGGLVKFDCDNGSLILRADQTNANANSLIAFYIDDNEKARIDSSGNVGIGTSSPAYALDVRGDGNLRIRNDLTGSSDHATLRLSIAGTTADNNIFFGDADDSDAGAIRYDHANNRMVFRTNATDNVYINQNGVASFFTTDAGPATNNIAGHALATTAEFSRGGSNTVDINRTEDGTIVIFRSAGNVEGSISVSGSTVSFNGGHLARWSQTADNQRIDGLLKGTVLTNLDQMAVWSHDTTYWTEEDELPEGVAVGDVKREAYVEENEQLNCMAVSSVEGDPNVSGVFVNWDDDDQTNTADMNIAMTGDMIIRIGAGVTVERGDLLMSAGDGTAKPQGDDIVRSKTIAKVTSTHVSCTYEDGSYCVPCVLMAC